MDGRDHGGGTRGAGPGAPGPAGVPAGLARLPVDFLRELMNVGSGNAASALARLLRHPVAMGIPHLCASPAAGPPFLREHAARPLTCATMRMVGDVPGTLLFLLPEEDRVPLAALLADPLPGAPGGTSAGRPAAGDVPVRNLADVAAAVFLTALHRFCGVAVHHGVPDLASDLGGAILARAFAAPGHAGPPVLLLEVPVTVAGGPVRFDLVLAPRPEGIGALAGAVATARSLCVG